MKKSTKIISITCLVLVAGLVALLVGADTFLNMSGPRAFIESEIRKKTNLPIHINKGIYLAFSPAPLFKVSGIVVDSTDDNNKVSIGSIAIGPDLKELLRGNIRIRTLKIEKPELHLDVTKQQETVQQPPPLPEPQKPGPTFYINDLSVSNGNIRYKGNNTLIHLSDIQLSGEKLDLVRIMSQMRQKPEDVLRYLKLKGRAYIETFQAQDILLSEIGIGFSGVKGRWEFKPFSAGYLGEESLISVEIPKEGTHPQMKLAYEFPALNMESFLNHIKGKSSIKGHLSLTGQFVLDKLSSSDPMRELKGSFSLKGSNLIFNDLDIDMVIRKVSEEAGYSLLDFAALFGTGPIGSIISNGFSKLDMLQELGKHRGNSQILQIRSDWKIEKGTATAQDVAFSTKTQRLAVRGKIAFADKKFHDLAIAVIDDKGCAMMTEVITGSFSKPEIKEMGVLDRTLFRPLSKVLEKECQMFYNGTVKLK